MISHGYWLSLKGQRGGDVQGTARIGSGFESRHAVIASARCLSTPYGFWGTKIIEGGIIVRQRHTYPNSGVVRRAQHPRYQVLLPPWRSGRKGLIEL